MALSIDKRFEKWAGSYYIELNTTSTQRVKPF